MNDTQQAQAEQNDGTGYEGFSNWDTFVLAHTADNDQHVYWLLTMACNRLSNAGVKVGATIHDVHPHDLVILFDVYNAALGKVVRAQRKAGEDVPDLRLINWGELLAYGLQRYADIQGR